MNKKAFTLIELLIVIFIIGLLVSMASVYLSGNLKRHRDSLRKSNLSLVAAALDRYYQVTRSYPSSQDPASEEDWLADFDPPLSACVKCQYKNPYIPSLEPIYISKLPHDLKWPSFRNKGYLYTSNLSDYKLMAWNTVESMTSVPSSDPYYDLNSSARSEARKSFQVSSLNGDSFKWW